MEDKSSREKPTAQWLLLIHRIPPKPQYLRAKVWRRLQSLGAVPIKNSVYVLPDTDQTQEDFQWVLREVVAGGGEAELCEARFVDGLSDEQVIGLFRDARDRDYSAIAEEARQLAERVSDSEPADKVRAEIESSLVRFRRRLAEVAAIDYFEAPARREAEERLAALETSAQPTRPAPAANVSGLAGRLPEFRGRAWVTRQGIHVDRIASAWLIRRFIDPEARFRFVPGNGYHPQPGEIRFDMFEAEFTHEGNCCTFEVLSKRFALDDPALRLIAEIIHDIDLKDSKFGREEVPGITSLISGIALAHKKDEIRLQRGAALLDDLYAYFRRQGDGSAPRPPSAVPQEKTSKASGEKP